MVWALRLAVVTWSAVERGAAGLAMVRGPRSSARRSRDVVAWGPMHRGGGLVVVQGRPAIVAQRGGWLVTARDPKCGGPVGQGKGARGTGAEEQCMGGWGKLWPGQGKSRGGRRCHWGRGRLTGALRGGLDTRGRDAVRRWSKAHAHGGADWGGRPAVVVLRPAVRGRMVQGMGRWWCRAQACRGAEGQRWSGGRGGRRAGRGGAVATPGAVWLDVCCMQLDVATKGRVLEHAAVK